MKKFLFFAGILIMGTSVLFAQTTAQTAFSLKSAPADLNVFYNGELIRPVSTSANGLRNYRINGAGTVRFSAAGYVPVEYHSGSLPVRKGIVGIKLENEKGMMEYLGEYSTGVQPKSAYFSPDGRRIFVPLLGVPRLFPGGIL